MGRPRRRDGQYQRQGAEQAGRGLASVKGNTDRIRVRPSATPDAVKQKIQQAVERNAYIGQSRVTVESHLWRCCPRTVASWPKREEVGASPGPRPASPMSLIRTS
jgi:hypothetical protein